ncbi:hypothetical protein D3C77_357260 [compost metagenome]
MRLPGAILIIAEFKTTKIYEKIRALLVKGCVLARASELTTVKVMHWRRAHRRWPETTREWLPVVATIIGNAAAQVGMSIWNA